MAARDLPGLHGQARAGADPVVERRRPQALTARRQRTRASPRASHPHKVPTGGCGALAFWASGAGVPSADAAAVVARKYLPPLADLSQGTERVRERSRERSRTWNQRPTKRPDPGRLRCPVSPPLVFPQMVGGLSEERAGRGLSEERAGIRPTDPAATGSAEPNPALNADPVRRRS